MSRCEMNACKRHLARLFQSPLSRLIQGGWYQVTSPKSSRSYIISGRQALDYWSWSQTQLHWYQTSCPSSTVMMSWAGMKIGHLDWTMTRMMTNRHRRCHRRVRIWNLLRQSCTRLLTDRSRLRVRAEEGCRGLLWTSRRPHQPWLRQGPWSAELSSHTCIRFLWRASRGTNVCRTSHTAYPPELCWNCPLDRGPHFCCLSAAVLPQSWLHCIPLFSLLVEDLSQDTSLLTDKSQPVTRTTTKAASACFDVLSVSATCIV